MNARLLASAVGALVIAGCAAPGFVYPLKPDELSHYSNDNMFGFVMKRIVSTPSPGMARPQYAFHPSHSNVMTVSYQMRTGTQATLSNEAVRPFYDIKAFCESKGFQFLRVEKRPERDVDASQPWPYARFVESDKTRYSQIMQKLGGLNYTQTLAAQMGHVFKSSSEHVVTLGARELFPAMDRQGNVGDFDCVRKSASGKAKDDFVWASVSIYPYQIFPTAGIDSGLAKFEYVIRVYQSGV